MDSSCCEALVRSSDRMTQPVAPRKGVRGACQVAATGAGRAGATAPPPPCRLERTAADRRSLRTFMEAIPGNARCAHFLPRNDGNARVPPIPPGRFGDRAAPWGNKVCTMPIYPHTAADTPESLRSCLGRLGDRNAPWGYEEARIPSTPTQRRIQRSPSGPAWAVWVIGTPRGGTRRHAHHPPPHSGRYTRVPTVLPGPFGGVERPVGVRGDTHTIHPHTAADTPESLRSCLGRLRDREALWGYKETNTHRLPHSGNFRGRAPPHG